MIEPSLILILKLMSLLTTMPGSANSICHNPTVTPTDSSRNVLKYHLLMKRERCTPLLMSKLQTAIKKIKGKGAAGPDNIPLSFLKSLSPLALQELFSIFNSSFSLANCPQIWRVAPIIPLLKAGAFPSKVALFHPISLTSCVVKLLECILANRLYYIAETNNMFS